MESLVKKVLVTGASGFIGSNLVKKLLELNWDVYILVRKSSETNPWRLKNIKKIKKVYFEDLNTNYNVPEFDVCFNLAAYGVDYSKQDINEFIEGNINFSLELFEFCAKNKTKLFVHTGSCFEYGDHQGKILTEEETLFPESIYGATKAASVLILNAYSKKINMPLVTVRPFGVYGEYEASYRLVPQIIKASLNNETMELTEGEQVRSYLYIEDLVNAYIALANKILSENYIPDSYETYNICSDRKVTIKKLVETFCKVTNTPSSLYLFGKKTYRTNESMYFVGDNCKIKEKTKWNEVYSLEDGLKKTYEWFKNYLEEKNEY